MSTNYMDRRAFLKLMGLSGSGLLLSLSGCGNAAIEEGVEQITSYVSPEDYVIPGDEVWYASTCLQCPGGCGIHARVREGRVRKLEGNPDSPVNQGRLCPMGQAGIQHHYNPDRLTHPLARKGDRLQAITWDEARQRLSKIVGRINKTNGNRFAWFSGPVTGHLAVLIDAFLKRLGAGRHYIYEPLAPAIANRVHQELLGTAWPQLHLDQARLVLSFGADFLGPWQSPVHFAGQYARFRESPRGTLIQVEPKMTLTGANADWWLPIRPGSEGWLALGLAHLLTEDPEVAAKVPAQVVKTLADYSTDTVSQATDISIDQLQRLAAALRRYRPSLVLVGGPAEGQVGGGDTVAAALLLNQLLGNIGRTLDAPERTPSPQLQGRLAKTAALQALVGDLPSTDTLFIYNANPVYTASDYLQLEDRLHQVATTVVFAPQLDETAAVADLVIPIRSYLEDWGTHVPVYGPQAGVIQLQQPVMRPLYPELPGIGDLVLGFLQASDRRYRQWADFYGYLRHAVTLMRPLARRDDKENPWGLPPMLKSPVFPAETPEQARSDRELDRAFWQTVLAKGVLPLKTKTRTLAVKARPVRLIAPTTDADYPFSLIPSPRLSLYDGRHANLPWLQELPDQLTTVVWDSWAELHPETAARLHIEEGDVIEIRSPEGVLAVKALLFSGIYPQAVAVPLGQGHWVGRYAKGIGVNPWKILSPRFDRRTGQFALYATRVQIHKTGRKDPVVKLATSDSQHNRRLVRTHAVGGLSKNQEE